MSPDGGPPAGTGGPPAGDGRPPPRRRRVRGARPPGPTPLSAGVDRLLRDLGAPSGSALERLLEV
ncbi:hypothetical protein B7486_74195, partial [cyanobacterium TDX16]